MQSTLVVMAGGALGAAMRFQLGHLLLRLLGPAYPYGTLAANLLGGMLMGILVGVLTRTNGGEQMRLLLGVGVLGGFTTFSAFSLDLVNMMERGAMTMAASYALLSVAGSVLALFAGLWIVRMMT